VVNVTGEDEIQVRFACHLPNSNLQKLHINAGNVTGLINAIHCIFSKSTDCKNCPAFRPGEK